MECSLRGLTSSHPPVRVSGELEGSNIIIYWPNRYATVNATLTLHP